jgi:hypothetical protein
VPQVQATYSRVPEAVCRCPTLPASRAQARSLVSSRKGLLTPESCRDQKAFPAIRRQLQTEPGKMLAVAGHGSDRTSSGKWMKKRTIARGIAAGWVFAATAIGFASPAPFQQGVHRRVLSREREGSMTQAIAASPNGLIGRKWHLAPLLPGRRRRLHQRARCRTSFVSPTARHRPKPSAHHALRHVPSHPLRRLETPCGSPRPPDRRHGTHGLDLSI